MKEFRDYDITIPELVYDILDYFRVSNTIKKPTKKSILDYCITSRFTKSRGELIQPYIVKLICENLVQKGILQKLKVGAEVFEQDTSYIFISQNEPLFLSKAKELIFCMNCMAYGFPYIYNSFKDYVLPVIVKDKYGNVEMGTCFRLYSGILTAKHCLEVEQVSILGYPAKQLRASTTYISNDPNIDLAYIELHEEPSPFVSGDANILDEVLVMGYPRIPMFHAFCAAERAAVSSIPTKGAVASLAEQYISPSTGPLMLVTARIRGGNSGGPIINANGQVVGVAFAEPMSEGNYDEMGYGVAYPIEVFHQMLTDCQTLQVNYVDKVY